MINCGILIVTVCASPAVFPDTSVAVHVTVVTPMGYEDGALFVYVVPGQLSFTVGVPRVTFVELRLHCPSSALKVTGDGAVMTGASVSLIVTVCVSPAVFPDASVAVHITVVTPFE